MQILPLAVPAFRSSVDGLYSRALLATAVQIVQRSASRGMEPIREDEEEYSWRELKLPPSPSVPESGSESERLTGGRRNGRDVLIAVDHGPSSKLAFDWALANFCRPYDTIHLVHAVSSLQNQIVYDMSKGLIEKLAVEALEVAMVSD